MPSAREYNGILFDQLTMLERIKRQIETGSLEAVKTEVDIIEREINRKLYQDPPLIEDK